MCDETREEAIMRVFNSVVKDLKNTGLYVDSRLELKDMKIYVTIKADNEPR